MLPNNSSEGRSIFGTLTIILSIRSFAMCARSKRVLCAFFLRGNSTRFQDNSCHHRFRTIHYKKLKRLVNKRSQSLSREEAAVVWLMGCRHASGAFTKDGGKGGSAPRRHRRAIRRIERVLAPRHECGRSETPNRPTPGGG